MAEITTKYAVLFGVAVLTLTTWRGANSEDRRIIERRGGKVAAVKYSDGSWELQVEGKPYFIKGVTFSPVKIGESPMEATMRDWMTYDDDHTGKNDIAYETWRSSDSRHTPVGDFEFLKEMGANTIRFYHAASNNAVAGNVYKIEGGAGAATTLQYDHAINKALLRSLYKNYGIRVMFGNFLGSWTIGSGASWDAGTDYTNPAQRENIKRSVKAMVLDNKDEPYVLFWVLGNENNIADWSHCNAKTQPEAYAKLIGELSEMIHHLDPEHPVAVCDGDDFSHMLKLYAQWAPKIDLIGYNSYRGAFGFQTLWRGAADTLDRPIFITEFGTPSYTQGKGEDEAAQLRYIKGCWKDIVLQSAAHVDPEKNRTGHAVGGIIYDWLDRWYMDGTPAVHNPGNQYSAGAPNQEWYGLMAMDSGTESDSLMRRPRKAYEYLQDVWNRGTDAY